MSSTNATNLAKRRLLRLLPCILGGALLAGAVRAQPPETSSAVAQAKKPSPPTTYRVINLGPGELPSIPAINAIGQVAYTLRFENNIFRAWFYDGSTAQDIGTLGGPSAGAVGVNNAGQVTGSSTLANSPFGHAFVWTRNNGMIDLGTLGGTSSSAVAINQQGQVAGTSLAPDGTSHALRWSASCGMEDVGLFAPGISRFTNATAIGDTGLVTGWGDTANGDGHAFAWTRETGIIDLGTLGGAASFAVAADAQGRVAGYATVPGNLWHAFVWNRSGGMMDLGTAGGSESFALAMAANGHVVGVFNIAENQRGFSWTQASGMVDLGTLGGDGSRGFAVNNKGQVVGGATTRRNISHAFVWTAREGMVDLNKRLRHAPAGLVVDFAVAISDNGSIVATSNAGIVLLKPDGSGPGMHTVGPIAAAGVVEVGTPLDTSVSFAGPDTTAKHFVTWSFGDGSGDRAGNAHAQNGAGSATGRHTFTMPGIYTMTAKVTDLAGKSATVSRKIVVHDRIGGDVGGNGWFMSPQGAHRKEPGKTGKAAFSFDSPSVAGAKVSSTKAELQFQVGTLGFRRKP